MFNRISSKERMLFARHMAIMSRAGMPMIRVLKILYKQTQKRSMKRIIGQLILDVQNGQLLHSALMRYENQFGGFFINLVKIGEMSGSLADNLEYLADSLDRQRELISKARGAMVYPIILLFATFGITGVLIFVVFPKILPVFSSLKADLPIVTKIFIFIANTMIEHGIWVAVGTIALAVGIWLLLRIYSVRYVWQGMLIYLPVIGRMIVDFNVVSFSRTMSLLLRGGTKIVKALFITSQTLRNLHYKEHLQKMALSVQQGETLAQNLQKAPRLFPDIFSQMVAVGEQTGKLQESAVYLAEFYERELDQSSKSMTNILEPLMLAVMGGIVGFVAIAIILPIYSITQNF